MRTINLQPRESQVPSGVDSLEVVDIFHTIQGEGPFAGQPAIFVRTAACNLQCYGCDTDYTSNRRVLSPHALLAEVLKVRQAHRKTSLLVMTGGEPFRQRCGSFVQVMVEDFNGCECHIQFETNGSLYDESMEFYWSWVTVVCSPKTSKLHPKMLERIDCLKYIIQAGRIDSSDGLPLESLESGVRPARPWDGFTGTIYVQPYDEQDEARNRLNTAAAVDSCMKHGYTLCLQQHKLLGLP